MNDEALRCSSQSRRLNEPLAGSAPHAASWILIEQPGPWGRDALTESHLDPETGRAITLWAADFPEQGPVRIGLIRHPGRHADSHGTVADRRVLIATTDPERRVLTTRQVQDPREVLTWDLNALLDQGGREPAGQAVLVCTNARRDQCCALLGRPLVEQLTHEQQSQDAQVWETSHLGGHRFAPTFVDLPTGFLFGGPAAATRTIDACRGRSFLPPPAQAAELEVMKLLGWTRPAPLTVRGRGNDFKVDTPDGQTFKVSVSAREIPARPESCGKAAVRGSSWLATVTR